MVDVTAIGFDAVITDEDDLAAVYGPPATSTARKIIDHLDAGCRDFIARSPFVALATADASGRCDVSPRGGPAGWVDVLDERRLVIPDAKGNNLVDSLANVLKNPHVGLLFVIPGLAETLRVNGVACLTRDPALLAPVTAAGRPARVAIGVRVEQAYVHCAKAFLRSDLWKPETWPAETPNAARLLKDHIALPDMGLREVQELLDDDYARNMY